MTEKDTVPPEITNSLRATLTTHAVPERPLPAQNAIFVVLAALAGLLFAVNLLPIWLPGITFSITGSEPKIYWFLSRGSAIAAYWTLWLAMGMGIMMTNKLAQRWPGIPPAYDLHQYTTLFGLGLAFFHALVLMGDHYINFNLFQVLVPFASQGYRPVWVGLGQSAFYLWVIIAASFYVRRKIGNKAWHAIHLAAYACFLAVLVHGIFSGTDSAAPWTVSLYWFSGAVLLFLTVYRVLVTYLPVDHGKPTRTTRPA